MENKYIVNKATNEARIGEPLSPITRMCVDTTIIMIICVVYSDTILGVLSYAGFIFSLPELFMFTVITSTILSLVFSYFREYKNSETYIPCIKMK